MSAIQRKWGALIMIELRWFPAPCVVAAGAIGRIFARRKLSSMNIVVATGAFGWCGAEIHILQGSIHRR
jgi:hypothetical protein